MTSTRPSARSPTRSTIFASLLVVCGRRAWTTDCALPSRTSPPGHPTPVRLDVTIERFSPEIETAAYFIAAEGLTNAVKHAQAGCIVLAVAHEAGQLVVAVDDDGNGWGGPPRRHRAARPGRPRPLARGHHGDHVSSWSGHEPEATLPCG